MATWEDFNNQVSGQENTVSPAWTDFNKSMSDRAYTLEASNQKEVDFALFKNLKERGAPQDVLNQFKPETTSYLRELGLTAGKGLNRFADIMRGTTQAIATPVASLFAAVPGGVKPSEAWNESWDMAKKNFSGEVEWDASMKQAAEMYLDKYGEKDEEFGGYKADIGSVSALTALGFFDLFGDPAFELGLGMKGWNALSRNIKAGRSGGVVMDVGDGMLVKSLREDGEVVIKNYKKEFPGEVDGRLSPETDDLVMNARESTGMEIKAKFDGDDLVLKPTEPIGGVDDVVGVPRESLPVGDGTLKVSRLEARMTDNLGSLSKAEIDELGLTTYNQMNKADNIKRASEFVSKNPDTAMDVLRGSVEAPEGILNNSIFVALNNLAIDSPDLARALASLKSTRLGQELSILTEINKASPVKTISNINKVRESIVVKKFKQPIDEVLKKGAGEIKIKKPKRGDWDAFISSISC